MLEASIGCSVQDRGEDTRCQARFATAHFCRPVGQREVDFQGRRRRRCCCLWWRRYEGGVVDLAELSVLSIQDVAFVVL